jgi:uncharacterized protein YegL
MRGDPWSNLMTAFKGFINAKQNSQNTLDFVSVVTYNATSKVHYSKVAIMSIDESKKNLTYRDGDTEFTGAFREAYSIIANDRLSIPIIIFMSDGDAPDPSYYIQTNLMKDFKARNLKIHSIAFGAQAKIETLNNIARVGGTSNARRAIDGKELFDAFQSIAASENTVFYEMVSKLTEEIGKAVADKLVLEYL